MKRILDLNICVTMCFLKTCLLSSLKPRGLCIIAVIIVGGSALPAYFYEMMDDLDEVNAKYDIMMTTHTYEAFKPTTTTTEPAIPNEWMRRGEYRIKCVDEVGVGPQKVITLMTGGNWNVTDTELKKWVLCVLNKMNIMSMEGVFRLDVALSKFYYKDKGDAESLIDFCLPKKPLQPYEIAWQYAKCHNKAKGNFSSISVF